VPLLEGHQDHAVIGANGRTVGERQVIGTLGYADVVDDKVSLPLGKRIAQPRLEAGEEVKAL